MNIKKNEKLRKEKKKALKKEWKNWKKQDILIEQNINEKFWVNKKKILTKIDEKI